MLESGVSCQSKERQKESCSKQNNQEVLLGTKATQEEASFAERHLRKTSQLQSLLPTKRYGYLMAIFFDPKRVCLRQV